MTTSWMRKPATLGLSLGVTLMASVFGCGGQGTESDAVVVPDSTVSSNPAAKTSAASAPGSSASSAATTPATSAGGGRAGQGRRLRHLQGPGHLRR